MPAKLEKQWAHDKKNEPLQAEKIGKKRASELPVEEIPKTKSKPEKSPQEVAKRRLEIIDEARTYLVISELVLLAILCFLSIRAAGASGDPFFLPISSFAILLFAFGVLINSQTNVLNHLTLKNIIDPTRRLMRSAEMMRSARVMIFVAILFAIILMLPSYVPDVEELLKSDSSQSVPIGRATYQFDHQDPFMLVKVDKIIITNVHNSEIDVYLEEKVDYDAGIFNNITMISYRNGVWNFSSSNGRAQMVSPNQVEIETSDLPYAEYMLVYNNDNDTGNVLVTSELYREISRPLLKDIFRLMIILAVANIIWHVRLYLHKRRAADESFILNEQRAKEAEERAAASSAKEAAIIEDVFLIYEDGRLIAHNTRRLKPNMDDEILTGMLTAVQDFVKDSLKSEEKGMLDELKFGKTRIFIESGVHVKLAVVMAGAPPDSLRPRMREVLRKIHNRFGMKLEDWDGDIAEFVEAKRIIMDVFE